MKRILVLIAVALIASGGVWAQTHLEADVDPFGHEFDARANTLSTENRYSAGRFGSDVDDYIDVNDHNASIGTFFFLGGYPVSDGGGVDDTNIITPNTPYTISAGFGKTLSFGYLAFYYGGSFVDAFGGRADTKTATGTSTSTWNNDLAILLGIANMGFRLDLTEIDVGPNTETKSKANPGDEDDTKTYVTRTTYGPGLALSWGLQTDKLLPGARIGFKFPTTIYSTSADGEGKKATVSSDGIFSLKAWTWLALNDTGSSIWTSLEFASLGATSHSGDKEMMGDQDPWKDADGAWGIDFYLHFQQAVDLGKVGLKIKPKMTVNFVSENNTSTVKDAVKYPTDDYFTFGLGLDLGVKYQHNEKFAFYTGASLDFLKMTRHSYSGGTKDGDDKNIDYSSEWNVSGIEWAGSKFTGSNTLGIGMTWSPAPGLVIGTGLNQLLEKFIIIDLQQMQVRTPTTGFWGGSQGNIGSWATNFMSGLTFDLTVSYKF
jgi:hypothetical protein